jgi:hypothetical protein
LSVTAGSEVAGRRMPAWRHPWWRKVDDVKLMRARQPSTSLVDVGTIWQRRGAQEDGGNWWLDVARRQWRGSSGAAHIVPAMRMGGVALARAAQRQVPS